ncbi:MAG: glycosyltransferase family 2 protein [Acidobacteriaceae bacterium]
MTTPTIAPQEARQEAKMLLSVIVPARNEQDCIAACLQSLVQQSETSFALGQDWELMVVDDGSTDRTRQIAHEFSGIVVLEAPALPEGWTGKANAVWSAAQQAKGQWLLFTDADTVHGPGDLRRALHEAEHAKVAMLSYSPKQLVSGFWQRALMPLVFSELAAVYPPDQVSNPEKRIAAANGQFLLVDRGAYFAVGGHRAVAGHVLEDVELASRIKNSKEGLHGKRTIRFRYAADALSARMYRSFGQMMEGWTKNLALLFPQPLALAAWRMLDLGLLAGLPLLIVLLPWLIFWQQAALGLIWIRTLWRYYRRVGKSNFPVTDCAITILAIPMFSFLLVRSWFHHSVRKQVGWKGRSYGAGK